jgi:antitoxin component of RelBE/YafQ-DinJ toxin-antitoxin module
MSIKAKPKKRGRPATGRDPMMGFRAAPVLRASIVKWAENQPDIPTLSEATRRLVELGLTVKSAVRPTAKAAARAAELAAKAIDEHADMSAPSTERESRKNRLLKGPSVFWDVRKGM